MHTKSNNIEIMMGSETDEIIDELFKSLLQNYQKDLQESIRGSNLFLIALIYCITIFKNKSEKNWIIIYRFSQVVKK